MLVDFCILSIALGEFGLYLLLHVLLFRMIKPEDVIKWQVYTYAFSCLVGGAISLLVINTLFSPVTITLLFTLELGIFIIVSLLVCMYIIGIFGIIESSIRIKLLSMIAHAAKKGITRKNIYKIYNKQTIINKRLLRLVSSGDVIVVDGKFYLGKPTPALFAITQLAQFINRLYNS
jgi:hypothetical protein